MAVAFAKSLLEGISKEDPGAVSLIKEMLELFVKKYESEFEVEPGDSLSEKSSSESSQSDDVNSSTSQDESSDSESAIEAEEPKKRRIYKK